MSKVEDVSLVVGATGITGAATVRKIFYPGGQVLVLSRSPKEYTQQNIISGC